MELDPMAMVGPVEVWGLAEDLEPPSGVDLVDLWAAVTGGDTDAVPVVVTVFGGAVGAGTPITMKGQPKIGSYPAIPALTWKPKRTSCGNSWTGWKNNWKIIRIINVRRNDGSQ